MEEKSILIKQDIVSQNVYKVLFIEKETLRLLLLLRILQLKEIY